MDAKELAKKIDHTNLNSDASRDDILRLCEEAIEYSFRAVCVNPVWVSLCHEQLKGHDILVASVIDFPLGQGGYPSKHFQATLVKAKGADELDVVWNIGAFLDGDYDTVLNELGPTAKVLPTKVITETGYIFQGKATPKERSLLRKAARLVKESGAFCIKTSTGHEPKISLQVKARHVKIFKRTVSDLTVKAAGGIKTLADAMLMIDAGADILGVSAGVAIMKEFFERNRR